MKTKWLTPYFDGTGFVCQLLVVVLLLGNYSLCTAGEKLLVAAAANFIRPMEKISDEYIRQSGEKITVTYGSSGKLFAQLRHGAPYDLFLSADRERPQILHKQGICEPPFLYAVGSVVLWSADNSVNADSWQGALRSSPGKVAVASPQAAPYGEKVFQVVERQRLEQELQARLVFGQSVGQTFLFARTGGAKFGFIALSQAVAPEGRTGQYWPMPEAEPVEQWGCVVTGKKRSAATHFRDFLVSEASQALIRQFGYQ